MEKLMWRENLKQIRKKAGHTQDSLSHATGISRETISSAERGTGNPGVVQLERLVSECGSTLAELFSSSIPAEYAVHKHAQTHDALQSIIEKGGLLSESITVVIEAISRARGSEFYSHPLSDVETGAAPSTEIKQAYPEAAEAGLSDEDLVKEVRDNLVPFLSNIDEPRSVVTCLVPHFNSIAAGHPDDTSGEGGQWSEVVMSNANNSYYTLRVSGDSMEPTLCDGDLILLDRAAVPRQGDIVAVWIQGAGGTLKRWHPLKARNSILIELRPDNPAHKIRRSAPEDVCVQGVVLRLIRRELR
jgi:SOS-response transcriptional repressor LexA